MGIANTVLASLVAEASDRELTAEERRLEAVALPSGQLVPLYPERERSEPRVIARGQDQTWD